MKINYKFTIYSLLLFSGCLGVTETDWKNLGNCESQLKKINLNTLKMS